MANIWFTSDNHFWHRNILKFNPDTRPGSDVVELNELMIQKWNSLVQPGDVVHMLGDVFFCKAGRALEIMQRLQGEIHLTLGNHDQVIVNTPELAARFASIEHYRKLRIGRRTVITHHYPYLEWEKCHHGAFALFGHVHGGRDNDPHCLRYRTMDVGIDSRPGGVEPDGGLLALWHWDQIEQILGEREILEHH